jgi:diguanylate cyclase
MADGREFFQAKPLAERALALMLRYEVPPTPRNYAVWYAHAAGQLADLSSTIELMIAHAEEFTPERNDALYARFIGSDPELNTLQQAGEHLNSTLSRIITYLEESTGETRTYNERLDEYSERLEAKPGLDGLRDIVTELASETQRVLDTGRRLEDQLMHSSGEITQLRENLAVVQREAMTDVLTGIPNRSYFERRLRELTTEATQEKAPLSLLLIDIDHFKHFNDTYGHQLGDQVLRLVAKTLTDCVKGRDVTARFGGEEFAILLPNTALRDAKTVAEQIRATMLRRRIVRKNSGDELGMVTLSLGVSSLRRGEVSTYFIGRADAALYHAKRNGRNRVASEDECVVTLTQPLAIPA